MLDYLDLRTLGGGVFWIAFPIFLFFVLRREKASKITLNRVGWPLLGSFTRYSSNTHEKLAKLKKRRGEVFSVQLRSEKVVVLNSERAIAEAFTQSDSLNRVPHDDACSTGHKSIFFTHGLDLCLQQREVAVHSFDLKREKLEEKIQLEIRHFLNLVEGYHGCQLDFDKILDRSTANVMSLLVFGKTFQYGEPELMTLIALLNETSNNVGRSDLHLKFPGMNAISSNTCSDSHAYQKAKEICKKQIEEHKQTFDAECVRDFLDSNLKEMKNKENSSLTDDALALASMDLIVAGTEALSSCIMWCMYTIAIYPDVKTKILKEVCALGSYRTPSFSDHKSMPYVQAFIHEIIRWKTIVPISSIRCASTDTTVCGYDIHKGMTVLANFWAVNHDPEVWDDPNSFKPERFLKDGEFKQMVSSSSFSFGNRRYPGETIVYVEVFLYIVSILQVFDVRLLPGVKPEIEREVIVSNRPRNYEICMPLRQECKNGHT